MGCDAELILHKREEEREKGRLRERGREKERDRQRGVGEKREIKGKLQRRRRSAQTPGVPTSLPLKPAAKTPPRRHRSTRSQHEGVNPASLPWRRPPLALGGRSRIVILCRRGAASLSYESIVSFELPSRTAPLSRVDRKSVV